MNDGVGRNTRHPLVERLFFGFENGFIFPRKTHCRVFGKLYQDGGGGLFSDLPSSGTVQYSKAFFLQRVSEKVN